MADYLNMALNWAFDSAWNAFLFYLMGVAVTYILILITSESSKEVADKVYVSILSWLSAFVMSGLLIVTFVSWILTDLSKIIYGEKKA